MKALEPLCGAFESELSDMLNKRRSRDCCPPVLPLVSRLTYDLGVDWFGDLCSRQTDPFFLTVTLSEDTRHAQPGPSRQVRRQKLYAFRPMHQDDTSHHATTRMATRRDQTTGVPSTALSVPAVGAGCVVTLDTQSRGHLSGVSLWRLERCHCWSPAWPLSWLLGVVVKADHHCCEAKVQLRDAAYHMLWDEENAAAVACGSSNLWVCLLLVSLNGTHIEPVLDWRERVEACWTLPSRGAWWVKTFTLWQILASAPEVLTFRYRFVLHFLQSVSGSFYSLSQNWLSKQSVFELKSK